MLEASRIVSWDVKAFSGRSGGDLVFSCCWSWAGRQARAGQDSHGLCQALAGGGVSYSQRQSVKCSRQKGLAMAGKRRCSDQERASCFPVRSVGVSLSHQDRPPRRPCLASVALGACFGRPNRARPQPVFRSRVSLRGWFRHIHRTTTQASRRPGKEGEGSHHRAIGAG